MVTSADLIGTNPSVNKEPPLCQCSEVSLLQGSAIFKSTCMNSHNNRGGCGHGLLSLVLCPLKRHNKC